jgi:hypothetical protein
LAQQQGFHPLYGVPDENLIADGISGPQKPDYANMANALTVSPYLDGQQNVSGQPNAGTRKCNAAMSASGLPNVYKYVGAGGLFCDIFWEIAGAANHAPKLERSELAVGLQKLGSIDFSYPEGPNNFSTPKTTTGGQYWRTLQFSESCDCFKPITPFKPAT